MKINKYKPCNDHYNMKSYFVVHNTFPFFDVTTTSKRKNLICNKKLMNMYFNYFSNIFHLY